MIDTSPLSGLTLRPECFVAARVLREGVSVLFVDVSEVESISGAESVVAVASVET